MVRCGLFRRSGSGVACSGVARSGVERLGEAVGVRSGWAWRVLGGRGMAVAVRSGLERYGEAGRGGHWRKGEK